MTNSINFEASWDGGKPLDALANLIAKRERLLRHESTEMAVKATAINLLTAIKTRTKIAKPSKAATGVKVGATNGAVASFKGTKGKRGGRRVVRTKGGHEIASVKTINLAGPYKRGEHPKVFTIVIKSPYLYNKIRGGYERVYAIANSHSDAKKWAVNRLRRYIEIFKGMARWTIGQAQQRIAGSSPTESVSRQARATALKHLVVLKSGSGFSSGNYSIFVNDKLNYATLALQNGESTLTLATMMAANRTAGILKAYAKKHGLDEVVTTPFPEAKG